MVDKTINDLALGAPDLTDELVVQRTGGGANVKYAIDALRASLRAAAEAHADADQNQAGITTTPVPLEGYTDSETSTNVTTTIIPSGTSNRATFTIDPGKDDIYRVTFNIDITSTTNENIDFVIYVNDVATNFKASVDLSNAAIDKGTASINTFILLAVGDVVEMYANSDGATMDILIDSITFTIQRL